MRALLPLALATAGCSYLGGSQMYASNVPDTPLTLVSSTPADGAAGVPLGAAISLVFSDFPDPDRASSPSVQLLDAAGTAVDATISVDLITDAIVIAPNGALAANAGYTVQLVTFSNGKLPPVTALSQAILVGASPADLFLTLHFTTGSTPGGGPTPPTVYTLAGDIQALFDFVVVPPGTPDGGLVNYDKCSSTNGCHAPGVDKNGKMFPAQNGLDLTKGMSAASLIDVAAFGEPGLSRVTANDPSRSYLLRKLLFTPDVRGAQMPLGEIDTWDPKYTRMISDWILTGAN